MSKDASAQGDAAKAYSRWQAYQMRKKARGGARIILKTPMKRCGVRRRTGLSVVLILALPRTVSLGTPDASENRQRNRNDPRLSPSHLYGRHEGNGNGLYVLFRGSRCIDPSRLSTSLIVAHTTPTQTTATILDRFVALISGRRCGSDRHDVRKKNGKALKNQRTRAPRRCYIEMPHKRTKSGVPGTVERVDGSPKRHSGV